VKIMAAADPIAPKKLAYGGASPEVLIIKYFTELDKNKHKFTPKMANYTTRTRRKIT